MKTIFKLGNSLYLKGIFYIRDNKNTNWAIPVDCPTIFEAYGQGIKSGNWQSCTAINTAQYVIKHYLDNNILKYMPSLSKSDKIRFWELAKQIEVLNSFEYLEELEILIKEANDILNKLETI